jgi:hypothetical protein
MAVACVVVGGFGDSFAGNSAVAVPAFFPPFAYFFEQVLNVHDYVITDLVAISIMTDDGYDQVVTFLT